MRSCVMVRVHRHVYHNNRNHNDHNHQIPSIRRCVKKRMRGGETGDEWVERTDVRMRGMVTNEGAEEKWKIITRWHQQQIDPVDDCPQEYNKKECGYYGFSLWSSVDGRQRERERDSEWVTENMSSALLPVLYFLSLPTWLLLDFFIIRRKLKSIYYHHNTNHRPEW